MGNLLSPFFLIASLTTLLLGVTVLNINRKNKVYVSWAFFCLSVSLWSFGLSILTCVHDEKVANVFYFIHYLGAISIPVAFLYFVRCYFLRDAKLNPILITGVVLILVNLYWFFTGDLVAPLTPKWQFTFYTNPGKYYPVYMAYFSAYVSYSFWIMLHEFSVLALEKKRKLFFIVATGIGYLAGSSAFLLVYFDFLPPFGILLFPLFPILTTYAIIRHKLLDIESLIKKTLVFAGVSSFVVACFSIPLFLVPRFFSKSLTEQSQLWLVVFGGMIVAALVGPLNQFLTEVTDKFLFQKKQEIAVTLKRLSEQVVTLVEVDLIGKTVLETLKDAMRLESGMVILRNKKLGSYHLADHFGYAADDLTHLVRRMVQDAGIAEYFISSHEILNQDNHEPPGIPAGIHDWLKAGKVRVVVPLSINEEKSGLILLGKKKSDQPFDREEVSYFPVIASQVSLAIRNALLIQDVIHEREAKVRAEHLAKRVEFAALIKHEIQNKLVHIEMPANAFMTYCVPRIKRAYAEKDERRLNDFCNEIIEGSKKINFAADRIRVIAQTAKGGVDEKDESFQELDVKVLWEDAKKESGLYEKCDFESKIPEGFFVYGNYHALQRTLVNLLTNAFDAMRGRNDPLIKLRCAYQEVEGKKAACFEVEDNGGGIPQEIVGKIFETGFSTKPKPDTKDLLASGHGQGLAACRMYIETIHAGKIWAESPAGAGAVFKFWIPVKV